jgi:hypothetical protein
MCPCPVPHEQEPSVFGSHLRKDPTKFDVASLLRVNRETEATENCYHLRP